MEFDIQGHTYKVSKLDAMSQFHIVRRLLPVLGELVPAVKMEGETPELSMDAIPAIGTAISKISDDDSNYVLYGLLAGVSLQEPNGLGWSKVLSGNTLMYSHISESLSIMLQLAFKSLMHNFTGFFDVLPSDLKEKVQALKNQSNG